MGSSPGILTGFPSEYVGQPRLGPAWRSCSLLSLGNARYKALPHPLSLSSQLSWDGKGQSLLRDEGVTSESSVLSEAERAPALKPKKACALPWEGTYWGSLHPPPNQRSLPTQEIQGEPSVLLGQPAAGGQECDWLTDGN